MSEFENFIEKEKARLKKLQADIKMYDELYDMETPIVTDTQYDELYAEMLNLEDYLQDYLDDVSESPSQNIVTSMKSGLKKVEHTNKVLSLQKGKTIEELNKFLDSKINTLVRKNILLVVQEKLDGLTIILRYDDGKFYQGVTRGNGLIGEDITDTLMEVDSFPKTVQLKDKFEVRCEAIITYEDFEKINVDGKYSNPRNLVSGTIRQLDTSVVKDRNIKLLALELIIEKDDVKYDSDMFRLEILSKMGFEIVPTKTFNISQREEIADYLNKYESSVRDLLPYMIDGMVIKIDDYSLRNQLGSTSKFPHYAIAHKFTSKDAITTLREIIVQVGKSGQVTPVAIFDSVEIDSVNIERATLHNFANITNRDLRINDKILIKRSNDVIPQVIKSFPELRNGQETVYTPPTTCPNCNEDLEYVGANLFCKNDKCTPIVMAKLTHFVSQNAFNIDGFGESIVEAFYTNDIIATPIDIFFLEDKKDLILELPKFGERKYNKLIENIERSKDIELANFLYSLSITLIGQSASRDIQTKFKTLDNILQKHIDGVLENELINMESFGDKMVKSFIEYLDSNISFVEDLAELVMIREPKEIKSTFEGLTFVITGKLSKDRNSYKKLIEELGGKVSGSVSKNTDYLLIGSDSEDKTSSKYKKAVDLDIKIIEEDEFNSLL